MNAGKFFIPPLSIFMLLFANACVYEDENNIPTKTEIATCLILTTISDDWYWVSEKLKKDFDPDGAITTFDEKLGHTRTVSCSFLFEDWSAVDREIINTRIYQVCTDDMKNRNPYLGDGLHCKQALDRE